MNQHGRSSNTISMMKTSNDNAHAMSEGRRKGQFMLMGVAAILLCIGGVTHKPNFAKSQPPQIKMTLSSSRVKVGSKTATALHTAANATDVNRNITSTVKKIILIGERHSGTNWITDYLKECFDGEGGIKVSESYSRFKHWFQDDDLTKVPPNSSIVILMVRNVYDWTEAMRVEPHHAHDHLHWYKPYDEKKFWHQMAKPMKWKDFVTKPWIGKNDLQEGKRGPADSKIINNTLYNNTDGETIDTANCFDNYKFIDVVPCKWEDSRTLLGLGKYRYELQYDGTGKPFNSIVALRRAKIINHLSVANFGGTKAFYSFKFEELNDHGTLDLLQKVEAASGLKAKCEAIQGKSKNHYRHRRKLLPKVVTKHRKLPKAFIKWLNEHVDWKVEGRVGYTKRG